ncbi:MAG TPA: LCP family protein [Acidimicrobiales bacterium]|nr:LCP family protein [Acidimicrobiales bacterium]
MPNGRPPADADSEPRPRTRRSVANEDGLRSLGAQMHESAAGSGRRSAIADPGPAPGRDAEDLAPYPDPRAPRRRRGGRNVRGLRRSGRPKMRRWTKALLVFGVVVVLLVGAAAGYFGYLNSLIHRIKVLGLSGNETAGALANTENILLVGSTSRCALKHQYIQYGLCSAGVSGVNSDVVMILHLNPNTKSVSILSLPRDLFVPNARTSGANKIDAALSQGPSQLVAAIQQDFGIPIQHYVELNFETFASVVDALGGINMYFPMPIFDDYSGITVTSPGCIHLDGLRALQVVRARHLQYKSATTTTSNYHYWPQEAESDLARIRRDHEFLRVLAAAVAHQGLGNPLTDRQIVASVAPQLTVDGGFSATDMINMVLTFHSVNVGSAPQLTVPVMQSSSLAYYFKGYDYGNIEFPSEPQDQQAIDQVFGINANTSVLTGRALPKPGSVSVSVLNGSGTANQATTTSDALAALGFNMVGVGDTPPPAKQSETVVYYAGPASEPAAEAVAHSLTGAVIMAQGPTQDGAQVTVVTGTDFAVNVPASASTGASSTSSGASSTGASTGASSTGASSSTGTSGTGSFAAPTPATESLQPWDPRSCSASGGEGP